MAYSIPYISIVMPVRNEARFIAETIGQLLRQDYPSDKYEIIVADGMSDDGTQALVEEMAEQHSQIRLMNNPLRRSSSGRNIGFRTGQGDYFLIVDGHCYIPDDQLLRNVADCFKKSGADCLGRPQPLDPPGLTGFQKSVALARASRLGHGGDSLIYAGQEGFSSPVSNGASYRREIFGKVGYVDEQFDACEDVEFNYRIDQAGLTCYTSPKLTVRYYPRENLRKLFLQMVRYGEGRFRFIKKHRNALTINQLIPAGFVFLFSLLLLSLGLFAITGIAAPLILISIPYGFYILMICCEALRMLIRNGIKHALPIPVILCVIHFALGYGFLKEATLRSRNRAPL